MKVLSLFDGISCFRVALGNLPNLEYLASEIDKNAIKVSKKNYPAIKHLGDVKDISGVTGVDLLVGGSPCTDLSVAMRERKGLDGERSKLFFEYVRIFNETKPRWFILENVASMKDKDKDIISAALGVQPVMIDAALVSAQTRKRYFWTNIPIVGLPADRKLRIRDILQPPAEVYERYKVKGKITKTEAKKKEGMQQVGHISVSNGQANRVYTTEGKSVTLTANGGGGGAKTGLYIVPVGYIEKSDTQGYKVHDPNGKGVALTARGGGLAAQTGMYEIDNATIRKLTPIECERLMGLPDNYTEGISVTQRYKAIGNAFHVEIMRWILQHLKLSYA